MFSDARVVASVVIQQTSWKGTFPKNQGTYFNTIYLTQGNTSPTQLNWSNISVFFYNQGTDSTVELGQGKL